jgi:hypothetical protein
VAEQRQVGSTDGVRKRSEDGVVAEQSRGKEKRIKAIGKTDRKETCRGRTATICCSCWLR